MKWTFMERIFRLFGRRTAEEQADWEQVRNQEQYVDSLLIEVEYQLALDQQRRRGGRERDRPNAE
jgi:hypothetical protein